MKIQSILVTGTDLVGKTTLIERLVPRLQSWGHSVTTNKDDLHKTPLMTLARHLLASEAPQNLLEINSILLLTFLSDSLHYRVDHSTILIQDSYACRTAAFAKAYDLTILDQLFEQYREQFFSFDVTIHLSASIAAKKQRLSDKTSPNHQDRLVETDPERIQIMDEHLKSIVCRSNNYIYIDTSALSKSEVADFVSGQIQPFLELI